MHIELEKINAVFKTALENTLNHWFALIAMIYAYASLLNIVYSNNLFDKFSVDIWEYYESHDVLIGAFMRANSVTWAFLLVAVGVISLAISSNAKSPKGAPTSLAHIFVSIIAITPFVAVMSSANEKAFEIMHVNTGTVSIEMKNNSNHSNMKLIGSAGKFHIYYKQDQQRVYAINEGEIRSIKQSNPIVITDCSLNDYSMDRKKFIDKELLIDKKQWPAIEVQE